jgi:hypothetical protein
MPWSSNTWGLSPLYFGQVTLNKIFIRLGKIILIDSLIVPWSSDVKQDIHTHLEYIITPYVVLYHGNQAISSNGLTLYLYKMHQIVNVLTIRCNVNVLVIYFHDMFFLQLIKFRLFEYWINKLMQSFSKL